MGVQFLVHQIYKGSEKEMKIFKRLILMVQFLTAIPVPINMEVGNEDFGKGLSFAPIVGLLLGGIMAITYMGLKVFLPSNVCAVLIIIEYIFFTGGLHLDGLGDTFDGLFSNRPKERILEIMRDSRVGTNAVLAIVSVLLLNVTMISQIRTEYIVKVLILFPVAGRIGSITGASLSKYARSGEGLGKSFIDYCGVKELILGLIFYFAIFYFVNINKGMYIAVVSAITAVLSIKCLSRKIDGATGDVLGAVCELNQTLFLISSYVILNLR